MKKEKKTLFVVRAKGPATEDGRIALEDLLRLGKYVQTAIERVARVLVGSGDSLRAGRKPKEISESCALDVVALNKACFEVGFDIKMERFEALHLGVESFETLLEGFDKLNGDANVLPKGYDNGVLHSLRDLGKVLGHGIDELEIESKTKRLPITKSFDSKVYDRVAKKIKEPVTDMKTVEGRLLMVDFRQDKEQCRIHPSNSAPILCFFDESLEETVYEHLRHYVRITGKTTEDPVTGKINSIKITDIEPLSLDEGGLENLEFQTFWEDKSIEQLAYEQDVSPIQNFEDVWGSGADLWTDEEDFNCFLKAAKGLPA